MKRKQPSIPAWTATPADGWLACGVTDLRRGMDSLAAQVQRKLAADPFGGQVKCPHEYGSAQ
jgi:transposase